MAIYVAAIDGMTSHEAADAVSFQTSLVSQEGVTLKTGTDLQVQAQGTPDMTVKVKKGSCYVLRDAYVDADNTLKFWHVVVTADTNVTITTNASGSTRIDRVCVKVDTGATPDAAASNVATLVAVAGTPGAGAPTVPDNHLSLAQVSITDGETEIASGDITDERTFIGLVLPYAEGYRLTDTGGNKDAQLYETAAGVVVLRSVRSGGAMGIDPVNEKFTFNKDVEIDAGKVLKVDTVAEKTAAAGVTVDGLLIKDGQFTIPWTDWAPDYSAGGSMTFTSVTTIRARYCQVGKILFFQIRATGTTGGTISATIRCTLPTSVITLVSGGAEVRDGGSSWALFNGTNYSLIEHDPTKWAYIE